MKLRALNHFAAPWLLLILGVAVSVGVALNVKRSLEAEARQDFQFACDQITLKLEERLAAYALLLQSGAYLTADGIVSEDDWANAAYGLRSLHGTDSLQVFGYQAFDKAGHKFPTDLPSESLHAAMQQAADTGRAALSGPVKVQADDRPGVEQGVFMYAPVYRAGWPRRNVAERRAAIKGWTYSVYRIDELLASIAHDFKLHANKALAVHIRSTQATRTDDAQAIHVGVTPPSPQADSLFHRERYVDFNGQGWLLTFGRAPGSSRVDYTSAWWTLAAGLVLSGLLFALVRSLLQTSTHSVRRARRLTRELQAREKQLRASEENLRSTLDTLPYLMFELDISGHCLACHGPADGIEAFDARSLIGRNVPDIMSPAAAKTLLSALREAMQTGHSHGQKLAMTLNAQRRWLELSVSRKQIEPAGPTRFNVLTRDITERERNKAELVDAIDAAERANCAKSRFLAAASHDLRQPLSALALYVGVLKSRAMPQQQAVVQSIDDCVGSLSELLSDLLDVSKLDAGVIKPQISHFVLDELLDTLVSVHDAKARIKGLRLRLRKPALVVRTDRNILHRMLGNLISNAIRYTHQGGVLIACRRHQGRHWVEVWDTGIGIAADKTGLIFEEFRQLDDGARNRGSGLGLAIVAKSAALLGLRLRVASRPGRGSMFAIEVPIDTAQATPMPIQRAPAGIRRLRIAIVDDNLQVLESLTMALQAAGHEVLAARDAQGLLQRMGDQAPDVLLSDYRLTGGRTGFDVITQARQAFGEELPAMLMTGDTDPALIRSMAEQGLTLQFKPLQLEVLLPLLQQLAERRQA